MLIVLLVLTAIGALLGFIVGGGSAGFLINGAGAGVVVSTILILAVKASTRIDFRQFK